MALILKIVFWTCLGAIAYSYVGYPLILYLLSIVSQATSDLLFLLRRRSRRAAETRGSWPSVAIVISAYNEEAIIGARLKNALEISYPQDRFEILLGLDSPSDATADIAREIRSANLKIFQFPERRGKLAVVSDLVKCTSAEVLVFTDANTMFEPHCVANLVRHFCNPAIGAVSGEEVRVSAPGIDPGAEGLYWSYESALKLLESRAHLLHSVNGGVYAIRRSLFHPPLNLIVEDFQIPLELRFQGHRILYDPEAVATEEIAPNFDSQFERRIRLSAGNFQTLFGNIEYLNPLNGGVALAYWSHRVLRWLTPFFMVTAFACSLFLLKSLWYGSLLAVQVTFYGFALAGFWLKKRGGMPVLCKGPLYFCTMNAALVLGLLRFCSGRQSVAWTVTPRQVDSTVSTSGQGKQ